METVRGVPGGSAAGTGTVTEIFVIGVPAIAGCGTTAEKVVSEPSPFGMLKVTLSPGAAPNGKLMSIFCCDGTVAKAVGCSIGVRQRRRARRAQNLKFGRRDDAF